MQDTQNAMKQELFILRNVQVNSAENLKNLNMPSMSTKNNKKLTPQPQNLQEMSVGSKSKETHKEAQKPSSQTVKSSHSKTLFVGDSISSVVDLEALKEATETEIEYVRAYSAVFDEVSNEAKKPARFPHKNYTDVISGALKKDAFENLIVQCGSVDITNLQTKNGAEEHFDFFHEQTVMSAKNLFLACEDALKNNPRIEKVVIMKQIPRYDKVDNDPLSIKQALSQIYNTTMTDLWLNSAQKKKIFVGNHELECSGGIRDSRYKNVLTGAFDGVHLFGSSGGKFYTKSSLNILNQAGLVKYGYEHQNCAQAQYQSKQRGFKKMSPWPVDKDVRKPQFRQRISRNTFNIPLKNRFTGLVEEGMGNF